MADTFLTLGTLLKWLGFMLSPLLFWPLLILILPRIFAAPAKPFIATLDWVSDRALTVARWLAGVMVLSQIFVIIGRYIFDWSATWATEVIIYAFAGFFLIAAASALKHDAHVRVDIFREKMSPRQKASIDLVGIYLFLIPICALILWASISPSFVRSWLQFEGSRESDGLPIYFLFRTLAPAFGCLLLVQALSEGLKSSLAIRNINPPVVPVAEGEVAEWI